MIEDGHFKQVFNTIDMHFSIAVSYYIIIIISSDERCAYCIWFEFKLAGKLLSKQTTSFIDAT